MIRARAIARDGLLMVEAIGHARGDVCMAATTLLSAAYEGLVNLARQYPSQISMEALVAPEARAKYPKRKKKARKTR
jgi:hypothetical protein